MSQSPTVTSWYRKFAEGGVQRHFSAHITPVESRALSVLMFNLHDYCARRRPILSPAERMTRRIAGATCLPGLNGH